MKLIIIICSVIAIGLSCFVLGRTSEKMDNLKETNKRKGL